MNLLSGLFGPRMIEAPAPRGGQTFLFFGTFDSELAATDFALQDLPKALKLRVTGDDIEIIFGPRVVDALPMLIPRPNVGAANTILLLTAPRKDRLADVGPLTFAGRVEVL